MISGRGKEFACYKEVEEMGITFYFAVPYNPGQRGTNENSNGLLKKFFFKEKQYIKCKRRKIERSVIFTKLKTKKMFKLCDTFWDYVKKIDI